LVAIDGEHGGVARVFWDRAGAELDHRGGGEEDEAGVEEHAVHHGAAHFEGVDGDEEEHAHADLDAALDGGPQKIEGEDGVRDDSEQGEGIVELDDDGVEEGAQATAAVKKQLEDDLQDPGYGDDDAPDAEEELGPGDDGVAARLLVANFQAFVFGFELVNEGFELICKCPLLPLVRVRRKALLLLFADLQQL